MNIISSQSKLAIEPRRVKFEFADLKESFYYKNNPQISALWAALSASFPPGEAEFIKSVKNFEDRIQDPKLKDEVKNFAHQEAHHSLQHKQLNQQFEALGFAVSDLDKVFKQELAKREKKWSHERRLARTVGAEHITAVWAHWSLHNPEMMSHFPESMRRMLQWHAIEEIEHKSVAFDVYQQCVANKRLLNWEYRYFAFVEFPFKVSMATRYLLKQMNYKPTKEDKKVYRNFLFGDNGIITSNFKTYMRFTKRDFHPWELDDSSLVSDWKDELSPHFV